MRARSSIRTVNTRSSWGLGGRTQVVLVEPIADRELSSMVDREVEAGGVKRGRKHVESAVVGAIQ